MNLHLDHNPIRKCFKEVHFNEELRTFFTILSDRDCFMARILYVTNLSVDEVLHITVYGLKECPNIPEYLKTELLNFYKKKQDHELLFSNPKGDCVQRAHLNQAFQRASKRMKGNYKITPAQLTKWVDQ